MSAHDQDHLAPIKVEPAPAAGRKIVICSIPPTQEIEPMTTRAEAIKILPALDPGRHYLIHSIEHKPTGEQIIKYTIEEADTMTTTTPAKRGRRPGTPNPNGGRHPGTAAKTRVDLTAEAAELLAEFAQRVNEARGQATRQDEIASAVIVRYLSDRHNMHYTAYAIAEGISAAQEAGTP